MEDGVFSDGARFSLIRRIYVAFADFAGHRATFGGRGLLTRILCASFGSGARFYFRCGFDRFLRIVLITSVGRVSSYVSM